MTIKKELENQIKIREDMNKKWGGAVYSEQEISNIKQKLKQLSNKEGVNEQKKTN